MDKRHLTIVGINFYPEDTAIGLYSTQMAEYLAHNYHVNVITGFPYYPEWKIRNDYAAKPAYLKETLHNIDIYRYKQYVPHHPTFKNRIVHLLDFTFGSLPNLFRIKTTDLVICVVPFTTSILLGLLLAKLRGAKIWVHIQDFEFDAAVESGLAGKKTGFKSMLFKILFRIEKKLFDSADIISTISYGMLSKLETKTSVPNYFFPNWVDENFINPADANRHPLMTSEKFKILYSGNIGAKQDWDFFVRIAEHYQNNTDIVFIVVGAGAKKEWLIQTTKELANVVHCMPVDYSELPDLLCSADLHILFQKNDVVDTVMPSKLLGMMASAKPSLITGSLESEAAKVFEKSGGGFFFDSSAFEDVTQTIDMLCNNRDKTVEIVVNARSYVAEHLSSSKVLTGFGEKIEQVLHSN